MSRTPIPTKNFSECLESGEVDAVYIALPNHMHRAYTEAAARAGVHVLCEKPMAVTEEDCQAMIAAAEKNNIKLMIAYRLHFEEANLRAVELVQSGKLGEPRVFDSVFTMQVKPGNLRLQKEKGEERCTTSASTASPRRVICSGPSRKRYSALLKIVATRDSVK